MHLSRVAEKQLQGPKEAFLFKVRAKWWLQVEVKRYCTKEGCSRNALMLSASFKPGEEVNFTSGLSSGVHLQGYMTWPRADVSSWKLSGQSPEPSLSHDVMMPFQERL